VLGGISNGMPIVARAAFKPTPSIAKEQHTVDPAGMTETVAGIRGRHDPCVVPRAVPVVEAGLALGILDCMSVGCAFGKK
jgi:chorismate synthase